MKERATRQHIVRMVGAAALLLAEACSSGSTPEGVARDFVSALSSGDVNRALSFVAPDVRRDPTLQDYVTSLATQLKGCSLDTIVVRPNALGGLLGASEQANVTFREPCGRGDGFLPQGTKFSSMLVGIEKTREDGKDRYWVNVNVFTTMAVPVLSSMK